MRVSMRRIKDQATQIRTSDKYLINILEQCKGAKHEKTTRMGSTFILSIDLDKIPDSFFKLANFLKKEWD